MFIRKSSRDSGGGVAEPWSCGIRDKESGMNGCGRANSQPRPYSRPAAVASPDHLLLVMAGRNYPAGSLELLNVVISWPFSSSPYLNTDARPDIEVRRAAKSTPRRWNVGWRSSTCQLCFYRPAQHTTYSHPFNNLTYKNTINYILYPKHHDEQLSNVIVNSANLFKWSAHQ